MSLEVALARLKELSITTAGETEAKVGREGGREGGRERKREGGSEGEKERRREGGRGSSGKCGNRVESAQT
jgi:hypothetical protein